jgi:hypothetical protein
VEVISMNKHQKAELKSLLDAVRHLLPDEQRRSVEPHLRELYDLCKCMARPDTVLKEIVRDNPKDKTLIAEQQDTIRQQEQALNKIRYELSRKQALRCEPCLFVTDRVKDDPFVSVYLGRSKQLFDGGLRTERNHACLRPVTHHGQTLTGAFLVSTYSGGAIGVITTQQWQWAGLTDEMDQGVMFAEGHSAISRPCFIAIEPQGEGRQ